MKDKIETGNINDKLEIVVMRPSQTAKYLGLSTSTLAKMRIKGSGPIFTKLGSRAVAYLKQDLDDYIISSRRSSTSCNGGL